MSKSFLTLELDTGEREFLNIEELQNWKNNERQAFQWISDVSGQDSNAGHLWSVIDDWLRNIETFIREFQNHPDNPTHQQALIKDFHEKFKSLIEQKKFISSGSANAHFIFQLRDQQSRLIAISAMNFLMRQSVNFTTIDGVEGAYRALEYKKGSPETIDAQQKALDSLKKSWAARFGQQFTELRNKKDELTAEIANLRDSFSTMSEKIEFLHNEQKTEFDGQFSHFKNELTNIAKTYDEKLALQSSVNYWTEKRCHHQRVMRNLGMATFFFAVVTCGVFIYTAYDLLKETISYVPLWKVSVLLAISTAGVWLTRLSAKIFISNLHLRADADERVTMMLTYLALLREGNGPNNEERQLILQTLFRPSTTGYINDDGPAAFHETMLKNVQQYGIK